MSALAATCLAAAALSSPDDLAGLAVLLLALNLFSSSQDVATDSLAVSALQADAELITSRLSELVFR